MKKINRRAVCLLFRGHGHVPCHSAPSPLLLRCRNPQPNEFHAAFRRKHRGILWGHTLCSDRCRQPNPSLLERLSAPCAQPEQLPPHLRGGTYYDKVVLSHKSLNFTIGFNAASSSSGCVTGGCIRRPLHLVRSETASTAILRITSTKASRVSFDSVSVGSIISDSWKSKGK